MKANRASNTSLHRDEAGVSAVVGAVLILAVLTMAMVQWRLEWVPVLEGEDEAELVLQGDAQMGAIRSHFNRLAANATDDFGAFPVKLGAHSSTGFGGSLGMPNGLAFTPTAASWRVNATDALVFEAGGTSLAVVGNSWTPIPAATSISDVSSVQQFRLRMETVNALHDTRAARVTILNRTAEFSGSYEFLVDVQTPQMLLHQTVRNSANEIITSRIDAYDETTSFAPYYVDLMDGRLAFDQVLGAAKGPLTLQISRDPGFDTDYIVANYVKTDEGSNMPRASSGIVYPQFNQTISKGSLTYEARNSHYPDQEIVMRGGAMVIEQADGSAFRAEPLVRVLRAGIETYVDITAPILVGDANTLSGDLVVSVTGTPLSQATTIASMSSLTMRLEMPNANLWASLLHQRLTGAGLSDSGADPEYSITVAGDVVVVTIQGAISDPAAAERDVVVRVRSAEILVDLDA